MSDHKRTPPRADWLNGIPAQAIRLYYTEGLAQLMAQRLIGLSCWFEVTPYPDDWWHFTFKNEGSLLREIDRIADESRDELL